MKFSCEKCNANYLLPDEKIGERGVRVRCKRCGHINTVTRTLGAVARDAIAEQAVGSLELGVSGESEKAVDFNDASHAQMDAMFDSIFQPGQTQQTPALGESSAEPAAGALEPAPPVVQQEQPKLEEVEREWWVAVDNQQVGPLSVGEVKQRIQAGVIAATTLVWRSGMDGWGTLESQAVLKSLLPQLDYAPVVDVASPVEHVETERRLGESATAPKVAWRPSAASELSELVKAELEQDTAVDSEETGVAGPGIDVPTFTAPTGGAGFGPRQNSSMPMLAFAVVVLTAGGVLAWQKYGVQADPIGVKPAQEVVAAAVVPTKVVEPAPAKAEDPLALAEIPKKEEPKAASPQKSTASKPAAKAAPKPAKKKKKSVSSPTKTTKKPAKKPSSASANSKKSKGGALDGVFDSKAPLQARLSQKAVTDGFRKNTTSLRPCIHNAISNREVTPGRHTLELSFDILPNGRVAEPRMAGPYYLQGTSLPKCLVAVMRGWRFDKSREGNKVEKQRLPFKFKPGS